jgi:hypothetical protein
MKEKQREAGIRGAEGGRGNKKETLETCRPEGFDSHQTANQLAGAIVGISGPSIKRMDIPAPQFWGIRPTNRYIIIAA